MKSLNKFLLCLALGLLFYTGAQAKELSINLDLPISQEKEAMVPLVAAHKGYEQNEVQTAEQFVAVSICNNIKDFIRVSIVDAHSWQFGKAGESQREQIITALENNLTCNATFEEGN